MSIWDWLLNPAGLTPHGFCLSWAPGLVWLHAGSDAIIGLAYFSVPLALASFVRQRHDLNYGWMIYLFITFILACGATHLMSIFTLWFPAYGVEGIIKLITAIASIAAVMSAPASCNARDRVLIVDDEYLIVMGLTLVVEDMGLEVCASAATADDAVALARKHRRRLS